MELDFRPFDADNDYYEPLDAFTRYQDQAMRRRGVQVLRRNLWVTPYSSTGSRRACPAPAAPEEGRS
jgi:hypothetical protein